MAMTPVLVTLMFLFVTISDVAGEYNCPENWKLYKKDCFNMNQTAQITWFQACDDCVSKGAALAKIENKEQNEFLRGHAKRDTWIGFHDLFDKDKFTYLDEGYGLNFTNWYNGEPNNAAEDCATVSGGMAKWNDNFCRKEIRFICETTAEMGRCDPLFEPFSGHCYNFNTTILTWFQARDVCKDMGGDLVIIETQQEQQFLNDKTSTSHWIGLNDITEEGRWVWLDQTEEASWMNWHHKEPSNGNNLREDCAYAYSESFRKGKWNNAGCNLYMSYICEKEKVDVNATCDDGWRSISDSCYLFTEDSKQWQAANDTCLQQEAQLVKVDNREEQRAINNILQKPSWIGLTKINDKSKWSWNDEDIPANYTYWSYREPTSPIVKDFDCVAVHATTTHRGQWFNAQCGEQMGYICETTTAPCPGGNSSWLSFSGHCYSMNFDATTWSLARQRCRLQDRLADLATLEGRAEQNFINGLIGNKRADLSSYKGFWIGLNGLQQKQPGIFSWLNGTNEATWTYWAPHEPTIFQEESCVEMKGVGWSSKGKWNDNSCNKPRGYICQKPADGDATYYDFKLNNTIYKITKHKLTYDDGKAFCTNLLGDGATLLRITSKDEKDAISKELNVHMAISSVLNFWLESDRDSENKTSRGNRRRAIPTEERVGDLYYEWGSPQPSQATPGRFCVLMAPRRNYKYGYKNVVYDWFMHRNPCCTMKMIICQKEKVRTTLQNNLYDFAWNGSIYTYISSELQTYQNAIQKCQSLLQGVGKLAMVESEAELVTITAEMRVHHQGDDLQYWIGGDPTNGAGFSYANFNSTPSKDEKCLMLSHNSFHESNWQDNKLQMIPTTCDGKKSFICKRKLYIKGIDLYDPNQPNPDPDFAYWNSGGAKVGQVSGDCIGPCLGLAIAFPFAVIGAMIVTAIVILYFKRSHHLSFMFNKAQDEVYLTA